VLECVPNVSEGRDRTVIAALARACGDRLVDLHSDADHNRSVFTLAGDATSTIAAMDALAHAVAAHVSIATHRGVHPRFGALDVVPFVALTPDNDARDAALRFGSWWSTQHGVPVFFYDDADDSARTLPSVRRDAFRVRAPDLGPETPHPTLGATAVGTRRPLIAINCVLERADPGLAAGIARDVRERDGGLPGVRALAFAVDDGRRLQVSMNLVDLERTGVEAACTRVRDLARAQGTDVAAVELVGLLPAAELARCSTEFLAWSGLHAGQTIEGRVRGGPPHRPGRVIW
jgi:glutamate formiminotransferase